MKVLIYIILPMFFNHMLMDNLGLWPVVNFISYAFILLLIFIRPMFNSDTDKISAYLHKHTGDRPFMGSVSDWLLLIIGILLVFTHLSTFIALICHLLKF